jgi:hypothetical protein
VIVEEAFAKIVGRQASAEERERLYRLRDALGLRDNDAFWSIVLALEHYDAFFRQYPAELARETARAIEAARATMALAATKEAAQAQRLLAERVAETSVAIARRLVDPPLALHRVTLLLAATVAFGALCVHAGYQLASTDAAPPMAPAPDLRGSARALAAVLSVPAGWMIFALLLPAAAYGVKAGWIAASDPLAEGRDKAVAWFVVAACLAGALACAALIAKVTYCGRDW